MSPNTGRRHRKATKVEKTIATATVLGLGLALPFTMTGNAQAATVDTWDKVAKCESTNNWDINNGNGFFGGLQFTSSTWVAFGGTAYAPRADLATKKEQILIAEKVLKSQGPGAWPVCSVKAELNKLGSAPYEVADAVTQALPKVTVEKATPAPAYKADKAVSFAKSQLGDRYVYGGTGPSAWDCSGLTQAAWKNAGVSIPRTSQAQWKGLPHVSLNALKPGDLIVFYSGASHIGIYVGNGKFVHAPNPNRPVSTDTLAGYYRSHAIGAVRPAPYVGVGVKVEVTPPKAETPKPTPKPSAPVVPATGDKYEVKPGDTLTGISRSHLDTEDWKPLYEANKEVVGSDPNRIFPGQDLVLPGGKTEEKSAPKVVPAPKPVEAPKSDVSAPLANMSVIQSFHNAGNYTLGYHTGTDLAAPAGTPVKAIAAGTVVKSDTSSSYGINVQIKHADGTYSLYAHLSAKSVFPGDKVNAGRMIGNVGSTGNSTGPHLHLEVRTAPTFGAGNFVDAMKWLADKGL